MVIVCVPVDLDWNCFPSHSYGAVSLSWNVSLMLAAGLFVNGPYALITTAVSADLGSHASVAGMTPWLALPHCCFRRSRLYGSR